jgi:hypothetical protein
VLEQLRWEDPVGDHALIVVEVVDEAVERGEALDETGLDAAPLAGLDDARDDVEGPRPVDASTVGVHGERDAGGEDVELRQVLARLQLRQTEVAQVLDQRRGGGAGRPVVGQQLVPAARGGPDLGAGDGRGHGHGLPNLGVTCMFAA